MSKDQKTIDLSDVILDLNGDNNHGAGGKISQGGVLTGIDLGLQNYNLAGGAKKGQKQSKSVDLSAEDSQKVSSYLAGIGKPAKQKANLGLSETQNMDTTEDLGYGLSMPSSASSKASAGSKAGRDFPYLSSIQFGASHTESGIGDIAEPSKIENLKFPNFGENTKITDFLPGRKASKVNNIILLPFFLLVFGVFYYSLGDSETINNFFADFFSGSNEPDEESNLSEEDQPKFKAKTKGRILKKPATIMASKEKIEIKNPYWPLPNPAPVKIVSELRLNSAQEERWRFGLSHQFTYRRFATIQDIRKSHVQGSEALLLEALEQPKFWARMEALSGLVELGLNVNVDVVSQALGDARPDLVTNYMRRLSDFPSSGSLYIMRQAIRIVDAAARLVILKTLLKEADPTNNLYYAAARIDPSGSIQNWLANEIQYHPLPDRFDQEYKAIVKAYISGTRNEDLASEPAVQELEIEELSDSKLVDEVSFFQDKLDEKETEKPPIDDGFDNIIDVQNVPENETE